MKRHERRRTGRIDCHGRPCKSQKVRDSAGGHVQRAACSRIGAKVIRRAAKTNRVIETRDTDKHSCGASVHLFHRKVGVLERFPCYFQQQSLLRIETGGLARRNAKKGRVKAIDLTQKATVTSRHFSQHCRVGIVIFVSIPSVDRYLGDRTLSPLQQLPELLGGVTTAGKAARHSDYGDWFRSLSPKRIDFGAPMAQLLQCRSKR